MSLAKIAEPPARALSEELARLERIPRITRSARPARPAQHTAIGREELLDRLHQLRTIIPAFAQELAGVRRVAAQLRQDNRRLQAEVQRLQHAQHSSRGTRAGG